MKDEEDKDENVIGVVRYACLPSLVSLQQMRNRLHLAKVGRKLMKWTAMATRKETRKIASDMVIAYDGFEQDLRTAFMLLARSRYFHVNFNAIVIEHVQRQANITVDTTTTSVTGVRVLVYNIMENGEPYLHLGLARGGEVIKQAKRAWAGLLKLMIHMAQLRDSFELIEDAHRSATKKHNVLNKVVIPRLNLTITYILNEMEEMAREEFFRTKRMLQLKRRRNKKKDLPKDSCTCSFSSDSFPPSNNKRTNKGSTVCSVCESICETILRIEGDESQWIELKERVSKIKGFRGLDSIDIECKSSDIPVKKSSTGMNKLKTNLKKTSNSSNVDTNKRRLKSPEKSPISSICSSGTINNEIPVKKSSQKINKNNELDIIELKKHVSKIVHLCESIENNTTTVEERKRRKKSSTPSTCSSCATSNEIPVKKSSPRIHKCNFENTSTTSNVGINKRSLKSSKKSSTPSACSSCGVSNEIPVKKSSPRIHKCNFENISTTSNVYINKRSLKSPKKSSTPSACSSCGISNEIPVKKSSPRMHKCNFEKTPTTSNVVTNKRSLKGREKSSVTSICSSNSIGNKNKTNKRYPNSPESSCLANSCKSASGVSKAISVGHSRNDVKEIIRVIRVQHDDHETVSQDKTIIRTKRAPSPRDPSCSKSPSGSLSSIHSGRITFHSSKTSTKSCPFPGNKNVQLVTIDDTNMFRKPRSLSDGALLKNKYSLHSFSSSIDENLKKESTSSFNHSDSSVILNCDSVECMEEITCYTNFNENQSKEESFTSSNTYGNKHSQ